MSENCRFCLKNMDFCEKFHEINDEIKKDFIHVTNTELLVTGCNINIICEMCLRSLQLASILKSQLIDNQEKFRRDFEFSTIKFEDEYYEEPARTNKKRKSNNRNSSTPKNNEDECINKNLTVEIKVKEENPTDAIIFENSQTNEQSQPTFSGHIYSKHSKDKAQVNKQITHSAEKDVTCKICGKKLKSEKLLAHMLIHHSDRKYQCDVCGKPYSDKTALHDHIRFNHVRKMEFKCKLCSKSYFKNNSLTRHIKSIHKKQTFFCGFPGCMKDFNFKHNCKVHIMRKHPSVKLDKVLDLVKQNTTIVDSDDE